MEGGRGGMGWKQEGLNNSMIRGGGGEVVLGAVSSCSC